MDFPALAQQYGIALAALTVVAGALGLTARALFSELKSRIERAEKQVDTIVPAIDRLSTAIDTNNKTAQQVLQAMLNRESKV